MMSVFGGYCESKCNKRKQSENLLAYAPKFPLLRALVVNMNFANPLNKLEKIEPSNRVHLLFSFYDGFTLLVEGFFQIKKEEIVVADTETYVESDFSKDLFSGIKSKIEGKRIDSISLNPDTGEFAICLDTDIKIKFYSSEGYYEDWELRQNGKALLSSECGIIIIHISRLTGQKTVGFCSFFANFSQQIYCL